MFKLKIVTPQGKNYDLEADRVTLPTSDGMITMLPNHMNFITPIEIGVMKVKKGDLVEKYAISEGLFTFKDNEASLLVDTVENSKDIDFMRAKASKERAQRRIESKDSADDIQRAEMSLKRSLIRLSLEE